MAKQDKVRLVFSSIVERIADYERRIADYEARIKELKTELANYKRMNQNLKAKLNNHQAVCKKCKLKTAALAEQLYQYNRLTDELLKVVKNPRILRAHAKKKK